jgi:hypothetical protein
MVRPILHKKRSEIAVIILTVVVWGGGGGWRLERRNGEAAFYSSMLFARQGRERASRFTEVHTRHVKSRSFSAIVEGRRRTHLLHSIKNVHLSLDALENRVITLSVQLAIRWWEDDSTRFVSWVAEKAAIHSGGGWLWPLCFLEVLAAYLPGIRGSALIILSEIRCTQSQSFLGNKKTQGEGGMGYIVVIVPEESEKRGRGGVHCGIQR